MDVVILVVFKIEPIKIPLIQPQMANQAYHDEHNRNGLFCILRNFKIKLIYVYKLYLQLFIGTIE